MLDCSWFACLPNYILFVRVCFIWLPKFFVCWLWLCFDGFLIECYLLGCLDCVLFACLVLLFVCSSGTRSASCAHVFYPYETNTHANTANKQSTIQTPQQTMSSFVCSLFVIFMCMFIVDLDYNYMLINASFINYL